MTAAARRTLVTASLGTMVALVAFTGVEIVAGLLPGMSAQSWVPLRLAAAGLSSAFAPLGALTAASASPDGISRMPAMIGPSFSMASE